MTIKLFISAIIKFTLGILMIDLLLFLPAWTFDYPGAWLLMGILFIPMFVAGIVLMIKNPELLRKRIKNEEEVLTAELEGYADYKKKVKYRLIPFVW